MMHNKHDLVRAREQALLRYLDALENGDGDSLAELINIAAVDPVFEQMVLDAHTEEVVPQRTAGYERMTTSRPFGKRRNPYARSRAMLLLTATLTICVVIAAWVFTPRRTIIPLAQVTPMPLNPFAITNTNAAQVKLDHLVGFGAYNGDLAWNDASGLMAAQGMQIGFYLAPTQPKSTFGTYADRDDYVISFDQTADGRYTAIARQAGDIDVYDAEYTPLYTIPTRESAVKKVRFSPDGSLLAAIYVSETVFFDTTSGDALITVSQADAVDVIFPGVKPLLVVYVDAIRLFNTNSGNNTFTTPDGTFDATVTSAASNPDFTKIVFGYADGSTKLWDMASNTLKTLIEPNGNVVNQIVFSPQHFAVIAGSSVQVFDAEGENPQTFKAHGDYAVLGAVFSPADDAIATVGMDGVLIVQELEGQVEVARFSDTQYGLNTLALSADGKQVATRGRDGVIIWDVETGEQQPTIFPYIPWMGIAFSPNGKQLAGLSIDGVALYNAETGNLIRDLDFEGDYVRDVPGDGGDARSTAVAFSPDGKLIAAGRLDGTVWLWDSETGEHLATFNSQETLVYDLAFNPTRTQIAVSSGLSLMSDSRVRVWDVASQSLLQTFSDFAAGSEVVRVALSQRYLAAGGGFHDPTLRVWDLETGTLVFEQPLNENIFGLAFSADGSLLASTGGRQDNRVSLWDAATGEQLAVLSHPTPVTDLAFSTDGTFLATTLADGPVHIWALENRGESQ